jgi:adhesin transport system outer membrane protein
MGRIAITAPSTPGGGVSGIKLTSTSHMNVKAEGDGPHVVEDVFPVQLKYVAAMAGTEGTSSDSAAELPVVALPAVVLPAAEVDPLLSAQPASVEAVEAVQAVEAPAASSESIEAPAAQQRAPQESPSSPLNAPATAAPKVVDKSSDKDNQRQDESAEPTDVSRLLSLRLGMLPDALGFPETLPVDASFSLAAKGDVTARNLIGLEDAMAAGVANSPDLAVSEASLRVATARREGALGQLLPSIDLRLARGSGRYSASASALNTDKRAENSIELRLPLFSPVAWAELRRQNELKKVAELELDAKRSSVALDAGLSFLGVLQAQGQLDLTLDYESQLVELLGHMQRRAAGGLASENEAKRVESRAIGAKASLSEARANLRGALSNYVRLVGFVPLALDFRTSLSGFRPDTDLRQLRDMVQDNFDLQTASRQIMAFGQAISASKGQFLPRVDFTASAGTNQNVGSTVGEQKERKAMVVLTYNLFAGGADKAGYREAIAKKDEQTARAATLERQLLSDAETALVGLNSLQSRYADTRQKVALDTTVVANFKRQLLTGNRPLLDVLDAHQRLYESKRELLAIAVTEAQAFLRFSLLTGRMPIAYNTTAQP